MVEFFILLAGVWVVIHCCTNDYSVDKDRDERRVHAERRAELLAYERHEMLPEWLNVRR
jgi:hypothetical protein